MKKGEKMGDELREKLKLAHLGKKSYKRTEYHKKLAKEKLEKWRISGGIPWNKGLKGIHLSPKSEFKKGRKDTLLYNWKGENASYHAIHAWVARWKGRPLICESCGIECENMQWSNIDHKYRRVLDDYIRMCAKCHFHYDVNVLGSIRNKSKKKK